MIISCSDYENCGGCPKNDNGECALQEENTKAHNFQDSFQRLRNSLQWETGLIMNNYVKRLNAEKQKGEDRIDGDELIKLYADALLLNVQIGYGVVLPIDDFYDYIKDGYFTDNDGISKLYDRDGLRLDKPCGCNLSLIETAKSEGAAFVAWFNK